MRIWRVVACSVVLAGGGFGCKPINPGAGDAAVGDALPVLPDAPPPPDALIDAPLIDAPPIPIDAPPIPIDAPPIDAPPPPPPPPVATPINLDLGHVSQVDKILRNGSAAVTRDFDRHWILWDLGAQNQAMSGDLIACSLTGCPSCPTPCSVFSLALAGATLAVRAPDGIELRDSSTGALLTTLADSDNAGLASDGSYGWIATATGFHAVTRAGLALVDLTGDFSKAAIFAAPDEIGVVNGPAGSQTLERIATFDSSTTTVSFNGTFSSWFDDGQRFVTATGSVVFVYSSAGAQQTIGSLTTVSQLTGQGNFVWTYASPTLRVYAVTDLSTPLASYTASSSSRVFGAGPVVAIVPFGAEQLDLVTLATGARQTIAIPAASLSAFGGDADGHWLVGAGVGTVFDGDVVISTVAPANPPSLTLGRPWSLSGSPGVTAALGVGARQTAILTLGAADTDTTIRMLDLPAYDAAITADETLLAATEDLGDAQYHADHSLRVISLATGDVTFVWPYAQSSKTENDAFQLGFELAAEAQIAAYDVSLSYVFNDLQGQSHPVYGPGPGPNQQFAPFPHLSPDAVRAAFTVPGSGGRIDPGHYLGATTQLFKNGTIVGAVNGVFLGWLDDNRLLAAMYQQDQFGFVVLVSMTIYDGTGNVLGPSNLPDPRPFDQAMPGDLRPMDSRLVYVRTTNAVYDTVTGQLVWQGDAPISSGAVVGHHIVYTKGRQVFRSVLITPPP